ARPAYERAVRGIPVEIGIVRARRERRKNLPREAPFDAVEAGAPDVECAKTALIVSRDRPPFDQILHFTMEIGPGDFQTLAEKLLLGSRVQLPASLRGEIRIAERRAAERRRKKQFVQRWRLETLGITRLHLRAAVA